ncbi:MAG TPA: hypothetical protein VHA80_05675, partial [Solirubrobacterales bacterium]|nr:hypothetical protein [Solirubrobacterales bacterium]
MAEQTQMDSLLGDDPAFAPVEPEPAPVPIAEPAPAFEAGAPPPITAAEAGYVEPELAPPVEEAVGGAARIAIRDLEDGQRVRGVYAV